jgi:pimeloyl-ACP methyl ester carboxylesterase
MNTLLLTASLILAADSVTEAVELKTPTGTLYAVIDLPAGKGPWPVVLLHPGSGPTDHDGNSILTNNDGLKLVGAALAAEGIACLRIDKRAIGKSAKAAVKEEDLRITTYVDDARAWVELLRKDKRFGKVGFIGHSEGSLIGSLAADAKFDAFVSLCGAGRPLGVVLREQLKKGLPKALFEQADAVLKENEAGREVKEYPKELAGVFRSSVQPYMISVYKADPVAAIAKLKCPVLILSGSTDIQVSEDDYKALIAAKKDATAVRLENMNHVLKEASMLPTIQAATYKDPKLPLHPKLKQELTGFLGKSLKP